METDRAFKAESGPSESDDVSIPSLDFQGSFVASPSGRWRLAIETATSKRPLVRWAVLDGDSVHSSGSAETAQVLAFAIAHDATFVIARRTGRQETTIEVRENNGQPVFTTRMEALATSAALSNTGRWAAIGFFEAKRGDEPVVVIDTDRREVVKRIPAKGGSVLSIDEERHVVISEDGEFPFGGAAAPAQLPHMGRSAPSHGTTHEWHPDPVPVSQTFFSSPATFWGVFIVGGLAALYLVKVLILWAFFTQVPTMAKDVSNQIMKDMNEQIVGEYEMASRHNIKGDKCRLAGRVAELYLAQKNDAAYARWRDVQKRDCAAARE